MQRNLSKKAEDVLTILKALKFKDNWDVNLVPLKGFLKVFGGNGDEFLLHLRGKISTIGGQLNYILNNCPVEEKNKESDSSQFKLSIYRETAEGIIVGWTREGFPELIEMLEEFLQEQENSQSELFLKNKKLCVDSLKLLKEQNNKLTELFPNLLQKALSSEGKR